MPKELFQTKLLIQLVIQSKLVTQLLSTMELLQGLTLMMICLKRDENGAASRGDRSELNNVNMPISRMPRPLQRPIRRMEPCL